MKILLIHNYYQYYGGEETYFHSVAKLLKQKGHEVKTYTKDSKNITNQTCMSSSFVTPLSRRMANNVPLDRSLT